jgi:hypothetical protein
MTPDTLWLSGTAAIALLALHGIYAPLFVALGIFGLGAVVLLAGTLVTRKE